MYPFSDHQYAMKHGRDDLLMGVAPYLSDDSSTWSNPGTCSRMNALCKPLASKSLALRMVTLVAA